MKKNTRLIFFLSLAVVGVMLLLVSWSMGNPFENIENGECKSFGAPLVWREVGLEKFNSFWATKNGINKEYCLSNGGTWGAWSKTWHSCYCAMSAPDAGKACSNSSECLSGACLYDTTLQKGKCAEFKMQYPTPGCELDVVSNGKLIKKHCLK